MRRVITFIVVATSFMASAADAPLSSAQRIVQAAQAWRDQGYRVGQAEQCMNWTREALMQACGARFATLLSQQVWDAEHLPPPTTIMPEDADSLASDDFGQKITAIDQLEAGDLVFLKNTYGDWAPGVITHVGIAVGHGRYIHRMTSNKGFVREQVIAPEAFSAGIRLAESVCRP